MPYSNARKVLITGGAGFIGSNLAERLLTQTSARVRILDNLSRKGTELNLDWLQKLATKDRLEFVKGDTRDTTLVQRVTEDVTEIYHFAAQVAVTSSVVDPREDFTSNMVGTFNVLEGARRSGLNPFLLFTSTNKVYGSLPHLEIQKNELRYEASDASFEGVDERELLDFHSPYGCSKGSADQYVRDYSRIYGIKSVVFRMSCIAGPRQFGTEDQGWVAHFLYSILEGAPITIYGNGLQVRDILHVHDLIDAMHAAYENRSRTAGEIFNLGGGLSRTVSILEMLRLLADRIGVSPRIKWEAVRPGDQPLYVSSTRKLEQYTGWTPRRSLDEIVQSILEFWRRNREIIQNRFGIADIGPLIAKEVA